MKKLAMIRIVVGCYAAFAALGLGWSGMVFANSVDSVESNPYMGAPTEVATAPNGAIGNKRIIDNAEKVGYLKPTIENPAPASMSLVALAWRRWRSSRPRMG